ncbi:MAG TPA: hypothetical protein VMW01_14850 [Williamwhitmania sp.]|nr:hypothetical protein [Williamwhitmania sp.]
MEKYLNRRGNSQVTHFQIEDERIIVWFKGGKLYSYSYSKAGKHHVEQMKLLAKSGNSLSAYITQNVRFDYD